MQEIEISSFDGTILRGTLSAPDGMQQLFIPLHGSFVQTRDGDLDASQSWMFPQGAPKRQLFLDMAKKLAPSGVGSFRYDKRASGKSEGSYADTDMIMLAKDAKTVLQEMKIRFPDVQIGFVGQSEGGSTALKAHDLGARPDFIVLQAPLLEGVEAFLEFQKTRAAAPFLNDPSGELGRRFPYLSAYYDAMYNGDMVHKLLHTDEKTYTLRRPDGWTYTTSLEKYRQYNWDGLKFLREVKVPVRIIIGSEDKNVSIRPISSALDEQGKLGSFPTLRVNILTGIEHSFREVQAGETFVDLMTKPVSPIYLDTLERVFLEIREAITPDAPGP